MVDSIRAQHEDRVNRIRSALWVYTSIAVSKLPALNDFWTNLQKSFPILPKEVVKEGLSGSLETLDDILREKEASFTKNVERLTEYLDVIKAFGVDSSLERSKRS